MKRNDTHAFVNQLLVCVLVTICFGGSIGLGTVWMRHQISLTANNNRALTAQIAALQRSIDETKTLVDIEQSAEALHRRNAGWNLGLDLVTPAQLVHVSEDPVRRLAAKAGREFSLQVPNSAVRVALGQ